MNSVETQTAGNWITGSGWLIVVFIGAFVLFGVIAWARAQNKKITPEQERRSEEATRDLYRDPLDEDAKGR